MVYCPPGDTLYRLELLHLLLDFIMLSESLHLKPIIMGDFNIHDLHVVGGRAEFANHDIECEHALVQGIMQVSDLQVMTDEGGEVDPTRQPEDGRAYQRPAVLDYIIVPVSMMNNSLKVDVDRNNSLYSDHVMIEIELKFDNNLIIHGEPQRAMFECWNKRDLRNEVAMRQYTESMGESWAEVFVVPGVQETYDQIHDAVQEVGMGMFKKVVKPKPRICRMPAQYYKLRSNLRKCRKELRRFRRYGWDCEELHREEWHIRMQLKQMLSDLKMEGMQQLGQRLNDRSHKNIQQFYDYVTRKKNPLQKHFLLRDGEGNPLLESQEVEEALFKQVDSIFKDHPWPFAHERRMVPGVRFSDEGIAMMEAEIQMPELRRAVAGLRGGKSAGPTDIPPELLKNLPVEVLEDILMWCNEMLQQGRMPSQNECSNMIFLYKKGDSTKLDNYRTLATGCNLCKIFLKVIANRLQLAAETSDILGEIQFGFRPNMSCADNLFVLDTVIETVKRNKNKYMMALLDISKAYDRVPRELLWEKLEYYGVPDNLLRAIKASYDNASSIIRFQNVTTTRKDITLGLKQGCVMSPILFSLYIADLGALLQRSGYGINIHGSCIPGMFFADDMIVWEEEKKFQDLLYILADYASHWKLQFSASKSFVLPIHRPVNLDKHWVVGFSPTDGQAEFMKEVDEVKYLGVTINRKHNIFRPHFAALKRRINYAGVLIRKLLVDITNPLQIIKNLWEIYIQSALTYGINAVAFPAHFVEQLEKMERSFLKSILGWPFSAKNENPYIILNITPLSVLLLRNRLTFRQSIVHRGKLEWVKKCLAQQEEWGRQEGFLGEQMAVQPVTISNRSRSYCVREIVSGCQRYLPYMEMVMGVERKKDIFCVIRTAWNRYVENIRENHSSMLYVGEWGENDTCYNKYEHKWWLRARAGVAFLGGKRLPDEGGGVRFCRRCGLAPENATHIMWECEDLPKQGIEEIVPKVLVWEPQNILGWLLSVDRDSSQ